MIILGVDTSLRSTGYGVLEILGNSMRSLEHGCIRNSPKLPLSRCIVNIHRKISALIDKFTPEVVSVVKVIYAKNANTMLALGQARGAVILSAALNEVPVCEYEPRRVKMSVCGNGMAEKEQIQRMIKTLLHLEELPQNDAADALAMAICHAHTKSFLRTNDNII